MAEINQIANVVEMSMLHLKKKPINPNQSNGKIHNEYCIKMLFKFDLHADCIQSNSNKFW